MTTYPRPGVRSLHRFKRPRRRRWPDALRDDVLTRLLEPNHVRAEQEHLSGAAAEAGQTKAKTKRATRKKTEPTAPRNLLTKLPGM